MRAGWRGDRFRLVTLRLPNRIAGGRTGASVVVVALSSAVVLTSCAREPKPMPPADASPRQVLDAYLNALQDGDCATTHAFAIDRFDRDGELCGRVSVSAHRPYNFERHPTADETQLAEILTVARGDESMPDGERYWFYTLRKQPNGAWQLSSAGSGP